MPLTSNLIGYLPRPVVDGIVRARGNSATFTRVTDYVIDQLRGQDVLVRDGYGKGLLFNSGCSNVGYTFARRALEPDNEREIDALLRPGMTFYDVGANFGWLSLIAGRIAGS